MIRVYKSEWRGNKAAYKFIGLLLSYDRKSGKVVVMVQEEFAPAGMCTIEEFERYAVRLMPRTPIPLFDPPHKGDRDTASHSAAILPENWP